MHPIVLNTHANIVIIIILSLSLSLFFLPPYSFLPSLLQFFFTESDIGKNCAEVCHPRLAELNSYVRVEILPGGLSEDVVKKYQVVVLTQSTFEEQKRLGDFCHANGIRFIVTNTKGLFG